MDPTRAAIDLPWGQVSYLDWHPGAEPRSTVVLLHGGGVDSASLSWGEVGARLSAAGHRVVAPDHPGFGESPRAPWAASQDRLVAYVGEFVDAVGLDQYTVGGLSLGGGLTIGHVLAHPERVTGTMMLGCYGLMDRQTDGPFSLPMHVMTWLMLRTGLLSLAQHAYGRNRRMLAKGMRVIIRDSDRLTDELLDELMSAAQREGAQAAFEQWQRDQFRWNRTRTNYTSQLDRFPRPALVVHGDRDTGVPVARARAAAELIPEARLLVVADAGHWVQRDRPDIVIPAMLDFLDHANGDSDAPPAHP
ncbi:alpha/beta fold hydrolase [Nonomuraea sp. NPDC004297]